MEKVKNDFIKDSYRSGLQSYITLTKEIGLWDSEKYVFTKYLQKHFKILDLGCGTGRTTFPLQQLGYEHIVGVDLTPEMISNALLLNAHFKTDISFQVGDARHLAFASNSFDTVIFSFNGLMSIPNIQNRAQAINEIFRVLRDQGVFIFTTHDRDEEAQFFEFWKEERKRWSDGVQNSQLHEFGDLITKSKNETQDIFIHIPDQGEVRELLSASMFKILETFYRSEKFDESDQVKLKSGECRFWIAKKEID